MIILYLGLAVLGALDAALVSFDMLSFLRGLRWLRIHLITLGVLTETIFALMPNLVAIRTEQPKPKFRWDIWAMLNAGILTLLVGIPLTDFNVILIGGTLVFTATTLLGVQLYQMRGKGNAAAKPADGLDPHIGRKFYIAGLSYFLLGIIVGTGLWMGWGAAMRMQVPLEVHIHANNWGLMSLVFAGLIIDLYAKFTGRSLASPRSITPIFWLMTTGAFGLVMGPWLKSLWFTVPGLVAHLTATLWLISNMVRPIKGDRKAWTPGMWHLVTSYTWILVPVLVGVLITIKVPGISGAGVEANAPQALIYGWVLQFGFALVPYYFRRMFTPNQPAKLGGNWFSLITVHLGGIALWISIFMIDPLAGMFHGSAYILWALSLLPILKEVWGIINQGTQNLVEGNL
jgi:hypothetical protein